MDLCCVVLYGVPSPTSVYIRIYNLILNQTHIHGQYELGYRSRRMATSTVPYVCVYCRCDEPNRTAPKCRALVWRLFELTIGSSGSNGISGGGGGSRVHIEFDEIFTHSRRSKR